MDFYGNRHEEKYTYKRVAWSNWAEHEEYGFITDGSIEMSAESELFETGSFTFEGMELPNVEDLLRVYYSFKDDSGELFEAPLATMFTSYSGLTHVDTLSGIKSSGSLSGRSVLSVLKEKEYGAPFTIARDTNAIYKAQELIRQCGLNVDYIPSIKVIAADHTFNAGTNYLTIVNWLCEEAGYTPAHPDPLGTVRLYPYDELQRRDDPVVFINDDRSIMYPELETENDWQETPNVVRLLYNTDQACITAEAKNLSGSKASLDARGGRELTHFEEIGELDEGLSKVTQLVDRAETTLRKLSGDIEYVKLSHAYRPLYIYEPVRIIYSDMEWTGNAENISIQLSPSTVTKTKIKRELYDLIQVEKRGEVLRGDEE